MSIILNQNHISINSNSELKNICEPLIKHFDINFFNYIQHSKPYTRVQLCMSTSSWVQHYYKNYPKYIINDGNLEYDDTPEGTFLWQSMPARTSMNLDMHQHFNIANGVTLIKKFDGYFEWAHFAANSNNSIAQIKLLNNVDLLERFMIYFRERGAKLIQDAQKQPVNISHPLLPSHKKVTMNEMGVLLPENKFNFINSLEESSKFKKNTLIKLTKREAECLNFYMKGKTANEISKVLHLSRRTVENYLQNAKDKMGVSNKFELIYRSLENSEIIKTS